MATYKTNSGKNKVVFFSNELADALSVEAQSCGKSPSWVVRQSVLEYLSSKGYKFTENANPEGRGTRSDLVKLPSVPESSRRPQKTANKRSNAESALFSEPS